MFLLGLGVAQAQSTWTIYTTEPYAYAYFSDFYGRVVGQQTAQCIDSSRQYVKSIAAVGQLGWSCFSTTLDVNLQEWTDRVGAHAVFVEISARSFYPAQWYTFQANHFCDFPVGSWFDVVVPQWPDWC